MQKPNVVVLIPFYNERNTVAYVIASFKTALPDARIYVYGNNSNDATAAKYLVACAIVRRELQQCYGAVVGRMFRDIEAEFYVIVDGDQTNDAGVSAKILPLRSTGVLTCSTASATRLKPGLAARAIDSVIAC
jgi:hypothetical protein